MNTAQDWQKSLEEKGLIETMHIFSNHVHETTNGMFWAGYSFAHIVIGDYNLEDGSIKWCLENEQVNDWLIHKLTDIHYEEFDSIQEGDDEYLSYDYWSLVDGTQLTIDFMQWLLTISEYERDRQWCRHHGLPDEPTDEDWAEYNGKGTKFNPASYPDTVRFIWINPNTGYKLGEQGEIERINS